MSGKLAVDIIVEHRLDGFFTRAHPSRKGYDSVTRCTCDWVSYEDAAGEMQARKIHAEHQVSVLAASGHTIVPTVLLSELVDPDPCWFDHHGGCQAHGYISLEPGQTCPVHDAKAILAAATAAAEEEK